MRRMKRVALGAIAGLSAVLLTACGGFYDVPLPGGAKVGDHPMTIHVQFDDVLDLVPQAAVKVDGVPVGKVDSIELAPDGWTAEVTATVKSTVSLPANAGAEVKQTNLLGEKFVELKAPLETPIGRLSSGATIPVVRTRHATDVEQVLGAMSLLLNGGGVAQLQPIVTELNRTLGGRESKVRSLLHQADTLIGGLDKQVHDIQTALDGLAALGNRTGQQSEQIGRILDELPAGIHILEEQRPRLLIMLGQLQRLGQAGYAVIGTAKENLIRDLRSLRPTLQQLGKAAPDIVTAFPLVLTYPFPDTAIPATIGGQMNTWLSVDLQVGTTLDSFGVGKPNPVYYPPVGRAVPVNPANPYYHGNGPRWPVSKVLPLPPVVPKSLAVPADPLSTLLRQLGVAR